MRLLVAATALLVVCTPSLRAGTIFVDNRAGRDVFDGKSAEPVNAFTGPVRSLRRALVLAGRGDTIVLKKNDLPYDGSLLLNGGRHSGFPNAEFTIIGNGAVIDGSQPILPNSWKPAGDHLWTITPWRKGHYLLLLHGAPVPELTVGRSGAGPAKLPEGHWCAWRGSIYYRAAKGAPPRDLPFRAAAATVGVSLYAVENVRIRDLTLRHFRLDGVNAHDLCHNVVLENVTATQNGRAGLAVGGSSEVILQQGAMVNNRVKDVLITELGRALFDERSSVVRSQLSVARREIRSRLNNGPRTTDN
jgi:hypothetical protein